MTDHDRNEFINLFNEGFEQVVLPHIERIDEKLENVENRLEGVENRLEGVENRLETVESRLDIVERKVDKVIVNQLDSSDNLNDHEKRIRKLEKSSLTV